MRELMGQAGRGRTKASTQIHKLTTSRRVHPKFMAQ